MNQFSGQPQGQGRMMTQEQQLAMVQANLEFQLNSLVAQNKEGFTDLQRRGINIDPVSMVRAQVSTLIESIAAAFGPQGKVWALQARLDWEQVIAGQIEEAAEQGTKAQLSVGGSFTPSMIRQLARESGTFGAL